MKFIKELDQMFPLEIPTIDVGKILKQPVDLFVESSIIKHFDVCFQLPEELLDLYHQTLHTTVTRAFDGVQKNLQQALQKEVQLAAQRVYQQNMEISKLYQEKIAPTSTNEKTKKKKDYLSRKRSSLKEKTLEERFENLYDGLNEVKEHRYQEKLQELQDELLKPTKPNKNQYVECLQQQSELFRRKEYIEKRSSCLFSMDQYYMRDMLLKKMSEMIEEDNESSNRNRDGNNDGDGDRGKSLQRKQSTNLSKSKMNSPKKTSGIVPKKRKSRRVRDSVA